MRALFVSNGMPGYNLLVDHQRAGGLEGDVGRCTLSCDELSTEARRIRRLTAQMNPIGAGFGVLPSRSPISSLDIELEL